MRAGHLLPENLQAQALPPHMPSEDVLPGCLRTGHLLPEEMLQAEALPSDLPSEDMQAEDLLPEGL